MDCPLLFRSRLNPCRSTSNLFANTLFLSDKYCKGEWFTLCPRFRHQQFPLSLHDTATAPLSRRGLTPQGDASENC
jgi:hypothetical protein